MLTPLLSRTGFGSFSDQFFSHYKHTITNSRKTKVHESDKTIITFTSARQRKEVHGTQPGDQQEYCKSLPGKSAVTWKITQDRSNQILFCLSFSVTGRR